MTIVELTGTDLAYFLDAARRIADGACTSLLIAVDDIDKAVKLKVDGGTWSPPMGVMV